MFQRISDIFLKQMEIGMKPAAFTADAPVSKSEQTRQRILNAACELFGARGYEGTALRDVEERSGVNRGLIAYHFGTKDDLWKAVVDFYFSEYVREMESQAGLLEDLDPKSRARIVIRNFVRLSVRRPHLSKLMVQENLNPTWRLDWIVERYLKPIQAMERAQFRDAEKAGLAVGAGFRYALIGACTMPFIAAPEMQRMHGEDPFDEAFVENFTKMITKLFLK
jgi:AcrR family transcriptional regulator